MVNSPSLSLPEVGNWTGACSNVKRTRQTHNNKYNTPQNRNIINTNIPPSSYHVPQVLCRIRIVRSRRIHGQPSLQRHYAMPYLTTALPLRPRQLRNPMVP